MPADTAAGPSVLAGLDPLGEVARLPAPAPVARRAKLGALRREALALARSERLVDARASWRLVPLAAPPGESGVLCVDGRHLEAPWLVPASGRLTALACAVATLGEAIGARIASLFAERRVSLAVALDALANEMVLALSRRVQDRMLAAVRRRGLTMAGELRAGDPGLALAAQRSVLELAGADAIGIALTATLMMSPTKSTSMVLGVGLALPTQSWSRCDACGSRARCSLAQAAA